MWHVKCMGKTGKTKKSSLEEVAIDLGRAFDAGQARVEHVVAVREAIEQIAVEVMEAAVEDVDDLANTYVPPMTEEAIQKLESALVAVATHPPSTLKKKVDFANKVNSLCAANNIRILCTEPGKERRKGVLCVRKNRAGDGTLLVRLSGYGSRVFANVSIKLEQDQPKDAHEPLGNPKLEMTPQE